MLNNEDFIDFTEAEVRMNKKNDLIKMYAKKAWLKFEMCKDWVEWGKVTMSELSQGILWVRLD